MLGQLKHDKTIHTVIKLQERIEKRMSQIATDQAAIQADLTTIATLLPSLAGAPDPADLAASAASKVQADALLAHVQTLVPPPAPPAAKPAA
jgi:hypothetical protein